MGIGRKMALVAKNSENSSFWSFFTIFVTRAEQTLFSGRMFETLKIEHIAIIAIRGHSNNT